MMLGKAIALTGAVLGGIGLSQFPEFSQQYLQRLAGQVDALSLVVQDFDASASRNGLSREAALLQMQGTDFLADRQQDLRRSFLRHARLSDNLVALRSASPLERMVMPQRFGDVALLEATWQDFRPAVPMTGEGLFAAGIGALTGGVILRLLAGLGGLFWRRRQTG